MAEKIENKTKMLVKILEDAQRKLEKSTVENIGNIRFGTGREVEKPELISTGIETFDIFIGGGIPQGRFTELFGDPKSGKTTIALQTVTNLQKLGQSGMWVDLENKWDPVYASILGVDIDKIIVVRVDKVEVIMNAIIDIAKAGATNFIVIDSVATGATVLEGEDMTKQNIAAFARRMSEWLPRVKPYLTTNNITMLCVNQVRENITKMGAFGKKSSGGNAWHHEAYLSVYMKLLKQGLPSNVRMKIERSREMSTNEGDLIEILLTRFGFVDLEWVDSILKSIKGITITKDKIKFSPQEGYPKESLSLIGKAKITEILAGDNPTENLRLSLSDLMNSMYKTNEYKETDNEDIETIEGEI
jgi:protein RecA